MTDALQGIVVLVASCVVLAAVVTAGGGIEKCMSALAAIDPGLITPFGPDNKVPQPMILSFWVLVGLGILGLPQTAQRCMSYKNAASMHNAMLIGTVVVSFLLLAMHLSAVLGRAILPDLPAGDLAMPSLTVQLLPPVWAGIFIAGPLAAIMSTVDTMMLMASAALIKDIYIHYALKGKPAAAPPSRIRKMSFGSTACIGLLVFLAALEPPDLLVWINLFAFGGLEAAFLWPIILGLYWKKANAAGAVYSVVSGVGCFFAVSILKPPLGGIHPIVPTLLAALLAFILGVCSGKKTDPGIIRRFWEEEA
jgi:sodium/pantothenate symporter